MTLTEAPFDHVLALTDSFGIVEHTLGAAPRPDCGYCVDDAARALVVVSREPKPSRRVAALATTYLRVVHSAQTPDGRFHNRLDTSGVWIDEPGVEDCWGRALWALATVAARAPSVGRRDVARRSFERSARLRSAWPRAMAFAALGAAEVLRVDPDHVVARNLLVDAVATVRPARAMVVVAADGTTWPWPEPRLRYANAVVPEILIAGGQLLGDPGLLAEGLALLGWLLETETRDGHLSVTPAGGWAGGEARPGFDQQPIEVAALADACATAFDATGDVRWSDGVDLAAAWFHGVNDVGIPLHDPLTGGSCDGLEVDGVNTNQGAESTLALVSTVQQALRIGRLATDGVPVG